LNKTFNEQIRVEVTEDGMIHLKVEADQSPSKVVRYRDGAPHSNIDTLQAWVAVSRGRS
jgi:hypothetical protein